jgi:glycosyltransferase involved in cell wall biosynthesis
MKDELVSIVMPTYNRAHLIGETIQSILAQNYQNWELIIADDGSEDNTKDVVTAFHDPRIKYHHFVHGHGMIDRLRNFGMRAAQGEFIALADSDDIWLPERLTTQIGLMKKFPSSVYSFCHVYELTAEDCISVDSVFLERNQPQENIFVGKLFIPLLEGKYIAYPSVIFRKEAGLKISWMDETIKSCHGFEYFLRLAVNFQGMAINEKLMKIRKHEQNTSSNRVVASYEGALGIFKTYYQQGHIPEKLYLHLISQLHYRMGIHYLEKGDGLPAYQKFCDYIKMKSLKPNGWVRLGQSFMEIIRKRIV